MSSSCGVPRAANSEGGFAPLPTGGAGRQARSRPASPQTRSRGQSPRSEWTGSAIGFDPDAAVVHEADLALDDLVAILLVLHRRALEVEVLRVDRLFVEDLVELGSE